MSLNNRIYTRKVTWRLVYMFNFVRSILLKNIYVDYAEKIETIVESGLNKVSVEEFLKYDFTPLEVLSKIKSLKEINLEDYLKLFEVGSPSFIELIEYASEFVSKKENDFLELEYIEKVMLHIQKEYEEMIDKFNTYLKTFKFYEIESITQSILLLIQAEAETIKTPKAILIKEAGLLADKFSSPSSVKLVYAILDKTIN